jgi:iron complex transport system substrate-binding protein
MRWLLVLLAMAGPAWAGPQRVVSVNLCTDQLAMLVAAPGQLVSVSHVASDPQSSAMAEEALAFPANRGTAEDVFLLRPDLVLASTWTAPATLSMLRRLGVRVETVAPATTIEEARAALLQVGALLGRADRAAALLAEFDAALAGVPDVPATLGVVTAANSFSSGTGTLADAIFRAAGLRNLAAERGITGMARLPLEVVVTAAPDLVATGGGGQGPALARESLAHPALAALRERAAAVPADARWICGTPHLAGVVRELALAARAGR